MDHPREFGVLPSAPEGVGPARDEESREISAGANSTGSSAHGNDIEKLSRIRDLLFGEAARDQAQRLDAVEVSFSAALAGAEERILSRLESAVAAAEAARSTMKEAFDSEVERLEAELVSTRAELRSAQDALGAQARGKVERSDFAALLGELARRVGDGDSEVDS